MNSSINRLIAYKKDNALYGSLDQWAKPSEILDRRAGDCEDFAILKMAALLSSGIPAKSMALVILQDRKKGFFHAVLAVNTPASVFILDNLSKKVAKDSELPDYQPLYSVSADRAWIHGAKAGTALLAEVKGGLAGISPGEGI
ncbi:transglutaminase-like cysteine peptidase (plasmid) [Mesorhizobium atlanticum]